MLTVVVCALLRPWLQWLGWIDPPANRLAKAEERVEVWEPGPFPRTASAPAPRPVPAPPPIPQAGTGHPISYRCPLCGVELLCPTAVQLWAACDERNL